MATLSRVKMNKARHQQAEINKKIQEAREKDKKWSEKHKETPEERKKKEDYILGVLGLKKKQDGNNENQSQDLRIRFP